VAPVFWNGLFGIVFGISVLAVLGGTLTAIAAAIIRASRKANDVATSNHQ